MSQALSTKTWFAITSAQVVVNLTEDEAMQMKEAFLNGLDSFETGEGVLVPRLGTLVCDHAAYMAAERRRRGDWQCKYGTWHDRKTATRDCYCGRSH